MNSPLDTACRSYRRKRGRAQPANAWLLAALAVAGCTAEPEGTIDEAGATIVRRADGIWEQLPAGARVRIDGTLSDAYDEGARVDLAPDLCARLAMRRDEWQGAMTVAGPGRRVTVYGSKASRSGGPCRLSLDRVGLIAR